MTLALVVNVACAHVPTISPIAFAAAIRQDSLASVDTRIFQVVSGGSWSDATGNGHYRVVVSSDGASGVHYTTILQWMGRRGLAQDVELLRSVDLKTVGTRWYSMLDPELKWSRGRWILYLDASEAPLLPATHRPSFQLGAPGDIRER